MAARTWEGGNALGKDKDEHVLLLQVNVLLLLRKIAVLFCRDSQRVENRKRESNTRLVVSRECANPVYGSGTMVSFLSIIYTYKSNHAYNPPNPAIMSLASWIRQIPSITYKNLH